MSLEKEIFKKGSTTYYWSSKFFPKKIREDVFKLYSYVRVMDNFVDDIPAQPEKLEAAESIRRDFMKAPKNKSQITKNIQIPNSKFQILTPQETRVVQNIVDLSEKYQFEEKWLQAFYYSMKWDADEREYQSLNDTLEYIYGSAEVIGLIMSKILGLKDEAMYAAQMQGRAMQFINFLRDIDEDNNLGRCYFPKTHLKKFSLTDLSKETAEKNRTKFKEFMSFELERYESWQKEAYKGFVYIPKRYRIAIATAVDGYNWTAEQIKKDPLIVFQKKIKPSKNQLLAWAAKNTVS